jgi:hypothetical protein
MILAAAGGGKRPAHRSLLRSGAVAPGGIAAKASNRGPVRHRGRRRRLVEGREFTSAIHHLAADNRQLGRNIGDLILRTGEVVAVGNDQVGERASVVFPTPDVPTTTIRIRPRLRLPRPMPG